MNILDPIEDAVITLLVHIGVVSAVLALLVVLIILIDLHGIF